MNIAKLIALFFFCLISPGNFLSADDDIIFGRDVRPILSNYCFACHGPDAESRESEFRLDIAEQALSEQESGEFAIVPEKPEQSALIRRVFSDDESEVMPPSHADLQPTQREKEILRRWVAQGGEFAPHWAFVPLPQTVAVPRAADWGSSPIDYFVNERLIARNIRPSTPAPRTRWLRRVTLDLTGLPPTAEEVREFEHDRTEQAFERVVQRLLASSRYGEHMAVDWLDAVRYADSYGYQSDQLMNSWPFRDWVIRALNENMRFDRFSRLQLAGDLVADATAEEILPTAMNRLHRLTNEGGSVAHEYLIENASDRAHTFGTVFLGLTFECARCHDHKFDPITTRDYYAITAYFNSIDESGLYENSRVTPAPTLSLPTDEQTANLEQLTAELRDAEELISELVRNGSARFEKWLENPQLPEKIPDLVGNFEFDESDDDDFVRNEVDSGDVSTKLGELKRCEGKRGRGIQFDGDHGLVLRKFGFWDRWNEFSFAFWMRDNGDSDQPRVILHRTFGTDVGYHGLDLMFDSGRLTARISRDWPGNAIAVRTTRRVANRRWNHVSWTCDGSGTASGLKLFINGRPAETSVVCDQLFKRAGEPTHGAGQLTLGERFRDKGFSGGQIDELVAVQRALTPLEVAELYRDGAIRQALQRPKLKRNALREYYFSAIDEQVRGARQKLTTDRMKLVELQNRMLEISVMREMESPRATFVLHRGQYDAPVTDADRVSRQTPGFLPFGDQSRGDRLGLAGWLANPDHPLTARVFVNRVWQHFFGHGLVATPEDFGYQGSYPSHPELLDWLARDFVVSGYDIKRLCGQIVLSSVYRQESVHRNDLASIDPQNVLLARGPSRRLSAEQLRDLALFVSGLLDSAAGGPPVSPYQPGGDLWREANSMSPPFQQSVGTALYRRSIYSVWKRTAPLPNMLALDAAGRETCTVRRPTTNTPIQALVLMNDVQFVEAARHFASRASKEHPGDVSEQIAWMFVSATSRRPADSELTLLTDLATAQKSRFSRNPADAERLLKVGDSDSAPETDAAQFAAMTMVAQTILNLDSTVWSR